MRAAREHLGLTLEQAAERIGIHAKHLQRIEGAAGNVTIATLVAVATAYKTTAAAFLGSKVRQAEVSPAPAGEPFHRLPGRSVRRYRNAIPLYPLEVAAGAFGREAEGSAPGAVPDPEAWVAIAGRTRPGKGLFVARVAGRSMSRRIPDGAYCVFRTPVVGTRQGRVVLVQHRDIQDPDTGGRHTVKIWRSRKRTHGTDSWRHVEVRLEPDSLDPGYRPIVIDEAAGDAIEVIAELVEVLPAPAVSNRSRRRFAGA